MLSTSPTIDPQALLHLFFNDGDSGRHTFLLCRYLSEILLSSECSLRRESLKPCRELPCRVETSRDWPGGSECDDMPTVFSGQSTAPLTSRNANVYICVCDGFGLLPASKPPLLPGIVYDHRSCTPSYRSLTISRKFSIRPTR